MTTHTIKLHAVVRELYDKFDLSNLIGRGAYGIVYSLKNDKKHVIKFTDEDKPFEVSNCHFFFDGKKKCNKLLIPLEVVYVAEHKIWAIKYERAAMNLHQYINNIHNFNDANVYHLARHLITAIKFIHDNKYVHGDICPNNILLINEPNTTRIVLSDYDSMTKLIDGNIKYSSLGRAITTIPYRPPELLFDNENALFGTQCDIWSFAIVMLTSILHECPFYGYLYNASNIDEAKCSSSKNGCICNKCHVIDHMINVIGKFDKDTQKFIYNENCMLFKHIGIALHNICDTYCMHVMEEIVKIIKLILFSHPLERPSANEIYDIIFSVESM